MGEPGTVSDRLIDRDGTPDGDSDAEVVGRLDGILIGGSRQHRAYVRDLTAGRKEPYMAELFRAEVGRGDVVVDGGAHLGAYSLLAGRRTGPEGRVYAFEPDHRSFRHLCRNVDLNDLGRTVLSLPIGLSDRIDRRPFYMREDRSKSGLSSRVEDVPVAPTSCAALDDVIGSGRVDVVKLDIEGGEVEALRGMGRLLGDGASPRLFVELNPEALRCAGSGPEALLAELAGAGFSARAIDEDRRRLTAVPDIESIEDHVNLFCRRS